ncbi:MAG: diaminopimelate decarboxylase [Thermomicrobiales bacterium]|nr:diaminopimelate decarboxylase [Thermomicrobiales bacterium]
MLWPTTATRDENGCLAIGGVLLDSLAETYGTPLYVFDVATIREQCRRYTQSFARAWDRPRVVYAGKAGLSHALLQIIAEEGLWLDVVSGGELAYALACGFPAERIHFHGNNKTPDELQLALESGIDTIVIDNFDEIAWLAELTSNRATPQAVLIRVNPGIDVHTHDYRKTGIPDSKFGLGIENGQAAEAVARITAIPGLKLNGFHAHVGSQIFEIDPFVDTVETLFAFGAQMRDEHGIEIEEMSPGGGLGIPYELEDPDSLVEEYTAAIGACARECVVQLGLPTPVLTIEPGRTIVGQAGVALYTVGSRKEVPGIRTYVSVDGGMADNIRPALYGAAYTAELVGAPNDGDLYPVTIAGKYCESGDILIERVDLPKLAPGDRLAIPAAGAYCLAMASNYNQAYRPSVVFVEHGESRLVQRRETVEDLLRRDVIGGPPPASA